MHFMYDPLIQIGFIAFLGIAAQWLGWRMKVPAIVFLWLYRRADVGSH